jgi:nucleotide-binding universal stress UspA family protein
MTRAHHAKLLLVRAVAVPIDVPQDFWKQTDEPLLDVLRGHCAAYLGELAARIPDGMVEKTDVRIGVPWEAICAAARDEHVDLLVIGSHGYSGIDRVLGTTAARIVNHAGCSVLVARPRAGT